MSIHVERAGTNAVIKLSGRLDMNSSPGVRKLALTLLSKRHCKNLRLDFTGVSYIDTSGLAILLEILSAAKQRFAQLTLSGLNESVRYLIDVNSLTGFFKIEARPIYSPALEKLIA
jgi:anti-anti-sigma factor